MNIISAYLNTLIFHIGGLLGRCFCKYYFSKANNGKKVNEQTLLKIINNNKNTEYGKKYNFSEIKTIEDYQKKVPLSLYEDYMDYIERSKKGETNLLTRKKIKKYATTSGTTGIKKYIPQSTTTAITYFKLICIYVNQCLDALKTRKISTFNVKGFCDIEITDNQKKDGGEYSSSIISAYAVGSVKAFVPIFTQIPADVIGCGEIEDKEYIRSRYALQIRDIKFISGVFMSTIAFSIEYIKRNMEMLINDIEKGTINPEIKMSDSIRKKLISKLKPDPVRAAELRDILNNPTDEPFISRLWPEMSFVFAIGTGDFEPFTKDVLNQCDKSITVCHSVYAATEALMAFAIKPNEASYLPLVDSVFFEFRPAEEEHSDRLLLINELEVGKLYEVIITTKSGLYRYQLRDVVRVIGYQGETPLIRFAYRANLVTNIWGIHVTNDDVLEAIKKLENEYNLNTIGFSIYANSESADSHLKLFIEFDENLDKEIVKSIEKSFENNMYHLNTAYAYSRDMGQLESAKVYLLKKNTYFNYRQTQLEHGASSNQLKTPRTIKDEDTLNYFKNCVLYHNDNL